MNRDNKQLTMLTVNMSIPLSVRLKKVSQELGINILSKKTSELSNDINKEKRLVLLLDCNKNFNERISLCKKIRNSSSMPIILIADFSDTYTRIKAFEAGCDDFISGVFNDKELSLKILSIIRRNYYNLNLKDENDCLFINRDTKEASIGSVSLGLTRAEYRLLLLLSSRPEYVFRRDELCKELGKEGKIAIRTVDSHIKNLRTKLSLFFPEAKFIRTVYGKGYGWEYKSTHIL
ncbi:response regulator transcription factor [Klebsiella quasipneumoniae subsp. quasipneumoniae]|uniref:response regulator transcription factor n=1 Tax=Klebsiella quasipneumoniae TaxID=1463165 RepID=UPI001E58D661|nr:response regulator transcription factor [Klebsiella quasipneumoniae]MCD7096462.1 response regulator transcription factor [Klebsiella quasipneumoniae subsp. similipneumoniae]